MSQREMSLLKQIDCVMVRVTTYSAARKFYKEALELEPL